MKKIIVIILSILIIVCGVIVGRHYLQKKPTETVTTTISKDAIENILPEEPLVYLQVHDVQQSLKDLQQSLFWQKMQKVNYQLLLENSQVSGNPVAMIKAIQKQLDNKVVTKALNYFFGQEFAFVVYPFSFDFKQLKMQVGLSMLNVVEELFNNMFLVTRLRAGAEVIEFLSGFANQFQEGVTQSKSEYKEHTIHVLSFTEQKLKLAYVRIDDLLVLGLSEMVAQKCVDVFLKEQSSLAQNEQHKTIKKNMLASSAATGYLDVQEVLRRFTEQTKSMAAWTREATESLEDAESHIAQAEEQLDEVLKQFNGFKILSFSTELGPLSKTKTAVLTDKTQLSSQMKCPPATNETFKMAPLDVMGYHWNNCLDLEEFWGQMKEGMSAATGSPPPQLQTIESVLGLNIEQDILPAIGDEVGGYLTDIEITPLFPLPKLTIFVKVQQRQVIDQLLALLNNQPILVIQNENYQGTNVQYVSLPIGINIEPGYCYLDDYLLISTNRELLKKSIDAYHDDAASLLANRDFKEVNVGLTEKNKSVQFIKFSEFAERAEDLLDWSDQWVESKSKENDAFKAGSELRLKHMQEELSRFSDELALLKENMIALEDEIWDMESQSMNVEQKQAELAAIKLQIESKASEVQDAQAQVAELKDVVLGFDDQQMDPGLRKRFLKEVIQPVVESFRVLKASGMRMTLEGNIIKSNITVKEGQ